MKNSFEIEGGNTLKFKRQEQSNRRNNNNNKNQKEKKRRTVKEDRLSNLPDEVIHSILSFVDATTAVQTSVLSKRWKHLWTSVPVLNLYDDFFDDPSLFQCFVQQFLAHRDASAKVQGLSFACQAELNDGNMVDSIIDYVTQTPVSTNIKFISMVAECGIEKLPQLSLCQSLTTLKLEDIATEITTLDFVSLEELYLFDCRFECVEEFLDPFRGCANLKCLFMHGCQYYGDIEVLIISAPQLTELSISNMRVDEVFDSDCVIELFTPKLRSFSYSDSDLYDFSPMVDLSFVEKVDIVLECLTTDADLCYQLIDLFEAMGSAKFVSLSPAIIEVLSMFPALLDGRSSPFTRVQSFELNMDTPSFFAIPTNVMAYLFG
ncbi:putative F-box/FBD/LRR-repeat protein At1g78760 [Abrus precatorius]|uniref:F-box/FBD/LRR-repeat protein At1g78760 n=1 Tax=Abrus precatorius TaxID=3816 RepID=A0A8B8MLW1_ABRPR|nr:putative F-box/FBD/LRR-repeat protein At1g78760 [Abrus precatorius]